MATQKGISVDDQFLLNFVNAGGSASTPTGTPVNQSNVGAFLAAQGSEHAEEIDKKQASAAKKAENLTGKEARSDAQAKAKIATEQAKADLVRQQIAERQQAAAGQEEEAAQRREQNAEREQQENLQATQAAISPARKAVDAALAPLKSFADRISTLPAPGGVGFLLLILMILLFAVVQVNAAGDTRMKQLWYMLMGRAKLVGREMLTPTGNQNTTEQDIQNLVTAFGQTSYDLATELRTDLGNIPVYGGIFTGVSDILEKFRGPV